MSRRFRIALPFRPGFSLVPKLLFGNAPLETPFREQELVVVAISSRQTEF